MEARGHTGTITFDGYTVVISRHSTAARMVAGSGTKTIPVQHIAAVQFKPAGMLVNGFIEFTVPGGMERQARPGSRTVGAVGNENAVVFTRQQAPAFERMRDAIQQAIARRRMPQQYAPQPASVADELSKLGALLQQGLLTRQEYEAQKARLLGR